MKSFIINILAILIAFTTAAQNDGNSVNDINTAKILANLSQAKSTADTLGVYKVITQISSNPDTVINYSIAILELAEKIHDTAAILDAYSSVAWGHFYKSNYQTANDYYTMQYEVASRNKNQNQMAKSLCNMANSYYMLNKMQKSITLYKESMQIYKKLNDSANIASIYRSLATTCSDMKLFTNASENIKQAIDIDLKIKDSISLAYDIVSLATMILQETEEEHEIHNFNRTKMDSINYYAETALKYLKGQRVEYLANEILTRFYTVKACVNMEYYNVYKTKKYLDSAQYYNQLLLQHSLKSNDYESIISAQLQQAEILYSQNKYQDALDIINKLKEDSQTDSLWVATLMQIYDLSAKCHYNLGNHKKAYDELRIYDKYHNSYINQNSIKQNAEFFADIKSQELIDNLINKQDNENAIRDKKIQQQQLISTISIIALIIVGIASLIITKILITKRHAVHQLNEINKQLNLQQEKITEQRDVINAQKVAAEKANLFTYQSICYARHIQHAALPSNDYISRIFPENFVYYLPKDIVSGDFYYAAQNAGQDIFVLADCTGHGVPGGFLSMLGISAIKEMLKNPEIDVMPGIILDMMREYIKSALANDEYLTAENVGHDGEIEESFSTADGMDMSIIAYDKYTHSLRFAGAYQSLYIARGNDIIRLKGDRMPVGRHINESSNFRTLFFETMKDDMIYLTSDGIPSQIGVSGSKFMTKRLLEFFKENHNLPCEQQKQNITNIMNDWMFGTSQIDDLSLVGIKVIE